MFSILIHLYFSISYILQFYFFAIFFVLLILRSWLLEFLFLLQSSYALQLLFPKLYFCILAFFLNYILIVPFHTWIQNHFQVFLFAFLRMFMKFSFPDHCYHLLRIQNAIFVSNFFFLRNFGMLTHFFKQLLYYCPSLKKNYIFDD